MEQGIHPRCLKNIHFPPLLPVVSPNAPSSWCPLAHLFSVCGIWQPYNREWAHRHRRQSHPRTTAVLGCQLAPFDRAEALSKDVGPRARDRCVTAAAMLKSPDNHSSRRPNLCLVPYTCTSLFVADEKQLKRAGNIYTRSMLLRTRWRNSAPHNIWLEQLGGFMVTHFSNRFWENCFQFYTQVFTLPFFVH